MQSTKNTKGFTLIELLVVITIIGILATGWVSIFTTQLQKARDSTRQSDIKQYQVAAEQYMSDNAEYPPETGFTGAVSKYVSVITQDPKTGQPLCSSSGSITSTSGYWAKSGTKNNCNYAYNRGNNIDGLTNAAFKLGALFEHDGNIKNSAADTADGGSMSGVFEIFAGWPGNTITLDSSSGSSIVR